MPDSHDQPAMPEREMWWLNPEEDGTMIVVDHPVASFPLAIRLVPESRLREVEAERERLSSILHRMTGWEDGESAWEALDKSHTNQAHLLRALRAEVEALTAALADADVLVQHYEGYALTAAVRANISDLRVGVAPEIIAAGERYAARILARREKGGA